MTQMVSRSKSYSCRLRIPKKCKTKIIEGSQIDERKKNFGETENSFKHHVLIRLSSSEKNDFSDLTEGQLSSALA